MTTDVAAVSGTHPYRTWARASGTSPHGGSSVSAITWHFVAASLPLPQVALLAVRLELAATHKEAQKSPVNLPEEFAGNEDGEYRPMTKGELEDFIDNRWRSKCDRLEREVADLKARLSSLESKG
jgi:hypothetical protein